MKTYSRTSLPDQIETNGKVYKLNINASEQYNERKKLSSDAIIVKVLAKNLRGKTDFHGKPYQPSVWVFTTPPTPTLYPVKCDQCNLLVITGVICHETGCPNTHKKFDRETGKWLSVIKCPECGCDIEEGETCCGY